MADAAAKAELHNQMVADLLKRLVGGVVEAGGEWSDAMVVSESLATGVLLACARLGNKEPGALMDAFFAAVRGRMEQTIALARTEPKGTA